jgi:hypothetical protein
MKVLLIINDAPYATEKAYNALRLAMALQAEQMWRRGSNLLSGRRGGLRCDAALAIPRALTMGLNARVKP